MTTTNMHRHELGNRVRLGSHPLATLLDCSVYSIPLNGCAWKPETCNEQERHGNRTEHDDSKSSSDTDPANGEYELTHSVLLGARVGETCLSEPERQCCRIGRVENTAQLSSPAIEDRPDNSLERRPVIDAGERHNRDIDVASTETRSRESGIGPKTLHEGAARRRNRADSGHYCHRSA